MAQIDGAGQQDTDNQNAEALQAALAQRQVTLQGQPQGGSDVPSHENSDPVSDEAEILRPCQALTEKRRVPWARRAMRLNSFSLQKKFSIKCRHLYISRSMSSGVERRGCWAMTALAPRSFRSATMSLLSKAVSPISAPKASPSMSGGTPTVSKRCPGKSTMRTRLPSASVSARILVVRPPLDRPMALDAYASWQKGGVENANGR